MSYDFWIEMDAGGSEPLSKEPLFNDLHPQLGAEVFAGNALVTEQGYARCGNYTSNVGSIWAKCLTAAGFGDSARLRELDGKQCHDVAASLNIAVEWGVDHLSELRQMNPPNGWGNAEGAVTYLWDIQRMCEQYPRATLRFSY